MLDEAQARAAQAETRQGEGDINTDDDDDDTAEYEHWHRREMARIARSACMQHTLCQAVHSWACICWARLLKLCQRMPALIYSNVYGKVASACLVLHRRRQTCTGAGTTE